ncbi:protein disks lost [Drosophila grimshawi]|uniref:GH15716 n=1 Tax=Drosophila grimshawi TaxID=7222 RepID=B4IYN8_DROGR|nr:protein disks lost [Drosophila grimshawi]EDV95548.1 GH15716 [Drosophila grimshawi]
MEAKKQQLEQLLTELDPAVECDQLAQTFKAHFQRRGKGNGNLADFAIYFLAALRQQTEVHFRHGSNNNETETSKCQTPVRQVRLKQEQDLNESQLSQLSLLSNSSVTSISIPIQQQGRCSSGQQQFSSTPNRSGGGGGTFKGGGAGGGVKLRAGYSGGGGSGRVGGSGRGGAATPHRSGEGVGSNTGGAGNGGGAASAGGSSFCLGDFLHNSSTPNSSQQRSKKKQTTPQEHSGNSKSQKPMRRVVPTTLSKNVSSSSNLSFGDTSSFSQENNLWRLSQSAELVERSQSVALEQEARKCLRLHRQELKNEAPVEQDRERESEREKEWEQERDVMVSLKHVNQARRLELLAVIYGQLLDLNLVPNVLSEISYALQLLNIQQGMKTETEMDNQVEPLSVLALHKECIYFAVKLLEQQSKLLLELDRKTLAVLLQHERISLLTEQLQQQLQQAYRDKRETSTTAEICPTPPSQAQNNVYYQHDKDSRDNFPSQNEFAAFKTQRDLFYKSLKHWEQTHLNRQFHFGRDVTPLVRDIFKQSEHVVNMSHLAKLCVSQLLMTSNETHESPEELGLKLDQQRLNRLAQRLVTSNSSVEDSFPRTQAFFRDFIGECGSWAFLVQIQLALYVQLLRHNDSSFELVPLLQFNEHEAEEEELLLLATPPCYIVRAQALAEMLLLAKFLGYVCALPYNRSQLVHVCPQQLQLRRQFQPPFEMSSHLERAMRQGKLLITLPWLVQYLAMLDVVTLQLPGSLATLELLYALYGRMTIRDLQPCAGLIVRSCLGWLLEAQPGISTGYYVHRTGEEGDSGEDGGGRRTDGVEGEEEESGGGSGRRAESVRGGAGRGGQDGGGGTGGKQIVRGGDVGVLGGGGAAGIGAGAEVRGGSGREVVTEVIGDGAGGGADRQEADGDRGVVAIEEGVGRGRGREVAESRAAEADQEEGGLAAVSAGAGAERGQVTVDREEAAGAATGATATLITDCLHSLRFSDKGKAASMLEQLLPVACPFLHEFRVSIAPSQQRPAQARNGRYRYITTRLEQLNQPEGAQSGEQSQPASSVHPQQTQHKLNEAFLHSQNASMRRLLEFVTERSFKCVVKDAQQQILLPSKAAADAQVNGIQSMQQSEVQRDLQSIYQQARSKATKQWMELVPGMLEQRIEQSLLALLPANTPEILRRTYAHLIREPARVQLQQWLQASVLQSNFYHGDLQDVASKVCRVNRATASASSTDPSPTVPDSNELCLPANVNLSQLLYELQQWVHCLSLRPEHLPQLPQLQPLVESTREAVHLPQLPSYLYQVLGSILVRLLQLLICRQPQLINPALIFASCEVWLAPQLRGMPDLFESLLSVGFVRELSSNPGRFGLLHQLLSSMLEMRIVRLDELNQWFMLLFKEIWPAPVWTNLSQLLQQLSQSHTESQTQSDDNFLDDPKSHLFMELLADLSRDLDF